MPYYKGDDYCRMPLTSGTWDVVRLSRVPVLLLPLPLVPIVVPLIPGARVVAPLTSGDWVVVAPFTSGT